jgi:hypothetical protein
MSFNLISANVTVVIKYIHHFLEYVSILKSVLFNVVLHDPVSFKESITKVIGEPQKLCSSYEKPDRNAAVSLCIKRFKCNNNLVNTLNTKRMRYDSNSN